MDGTKKTGEERHFIGISRSDFNPYWVTQKEEGWCWAACQESVFRFYGINEDQSRIAVKLCGLTISRNGEERTSRPAVMKQSVNHYVDLDVDGKFYTLNILMSNEEINPRYLLKELQEFRPIIVHHKKDNRALMITGAQIHISEEQAIIRKLFLRDPDPKYAASKGRRVVTSPKRFLDQVNMHWFVNTRLLDIPSHYNQIISF